MILLFTGFDQREAGGWHTFVQSAIERTTQPVAYVPLAYENGSMQKDGTNAFTYARFLVPELCGSEGWAIFVDGADMVAMDDLAELWALRDQKYAVQVVKHEYKTKHPRKYVGTEMESKNDDYPRKNWSSVIIWNNEHHANVAARQQIRKAIEQGDGKYLHRFAWLQDEHIGELPIEWNWLADEFGQNVNAKILHWTIGLPGIFAHRNAPHAQAWQMYKARSLESPAERRIAEVASQR